MSDEYRECTLPAKERAALRVWLIGFLAIGVTWRLVRYGLNFPFWGDEAYLNTSIVLYGFRELATHSLEYAQVAPLLFLWAQRAIFEFFGGGEFALRLIPLASGLAALMCFAVVARRALPTRAAVVAVAIFAVSYPLIRHSSEAKPYASDALVATLLLWMALHWRDRPDSTAWAVATTAVCAIGVWLSYPAVFMGAGISLALLPRAIPSRSRRVWGLWMLHGALLATSFAFFYITYAGSASSRAAGTRLEEIWTAAFPPLDNPLSLLWWLLDVHTGSMMSHPLGGTNFGSAWTTLLCLIGAVGLCRARKGGLLWLLVAAMLPALLAAGLRRYPYGGSARTMLWLAPTICLLAGMGLAMLIDAIRSEKWRVAVAGPAGMLLAWIAIIGIVVDIRRPYKTPLDAWVRQAVRETAQIAPAPTPLWVINQRERGDSTGAEPWLPQTIRYYLLLWRGQDPLFVGNAGLPDAAGWILAYSDEFGGPDMARIEEIAALNGLAILERHKLQPPNLAPQRVLLARCDVQAAALSGDSPTVR